MLKQFKNGGAVVIDKSHKALYRTPTSCMEYFNFFGSMKFVFTIFISPTFSTRLSDRAFYRSIYGILIQILV